MTAKKGARKTPGPDGKAPRPGSCGRFTRARLAEGLPAIVESFVKQARQGSVPHLKTLVQVSNMDRRAGRTKVRKEAEDEGPSLRELVLGEFMPEEDGGRDGG